MRVSSFLSFFIFTPLPYSSLVRQAQVLLNLQKRESVSVPPPHEMMVDPLLAKGWKLFVDGRDLAPSVFIVFSSICINKTIPFGYKMHLLEANLHI